MSDAHREYRCQWCQTVKQSGNEPCPANCDRPPGFRLQDDGRGNTGCRTRNIVLTPLGWETAGYVRVGEGWRKAP